MLFVHIVNNRIKIKFSSKASYVHDEEGKYLVIRVVKCVKNMLFTIKEKKRSVSSCGG